MPVKIRLQRKGRKQAPFYHIVIADARAPRDGRFIEKIGTYNPLTVPATIELNNDKAYQWLKNGAQPTDTVRAILRFKGVLYQKHLDGGVKKGAFTAEQAAEKLATWIEAKEGSVAARRTAVGQQKQQKKVAIDGVAKVKVKPVVEAPVVEEEVAPAEEVAQEVAAPVEAEVAAPVAEAAAPVVEETPAPVAEAAAPVEETPAPMIEEADIAVEPATEVEAAPEPEAAAEVAVEGAPVEEAAAPATEEEEKTAEA